MSKKLYEFLLPEVENVVSGFMEMEITEKDIQDITILLANNDNTIPNTELYDDTNDWLHYDDSDDWSDINNQIENVVKWYLSKNELVRMFSPAITIKGE